VVKNVNYLLSEITSTPTPTGIMILTNKRPERVSVEIEYEKVRQEYFPDKPSRFNCLWVAENSKEGEILIDMMFPQDLSRKTLLVEITPDSKVHKADKRWYERYFDNPDVECMNKYWIGEPFNEYPRWEYLIDGGFKISNEDILFLRKHFMKNYIDSFGKDLVEGVYKINPIKAD